MLYKEWRHTRMKFAVMLLIYISAGVITSTLTSPTRLFTYNSIFHQWVFASLFITIGAAIVAGSDTIAEETGKNTLSFLLTRPISRTSIYTVKFLVNALALTVVLAITTPIMLLVEQTPQGFIEGSAEVVNGIPQPQYFYNVVIDKVSTGEAFADLALIFGLGMIFLASSILVSIYTHNALQTIVSTLLFLIVPFIVIVLIDSYLNWRFLNEVYLFFLDLGIVGGLLLVVIAAGLYTVGLKIFKAKEF